MPDYDDTNKGVLFRNERKENEKHPDYNGNINVNGHASHYSVAAACGKNIPFGTAFQIDILTQCGACIRMRATL